MQGGGGDNFESSHLVTWISVNSLNRDKEPERTTERGGERMSSVFFGLLRGHSEWWCLAGK